MNFPLKYTINKRNAIPPSKPEENAVVHGLCNPEIAVKAKPFEVIKIDTGLSFEMVGPYYMQFMNVLEKFLLLGKVIDTGYRGGVIVALRNITDKDQVIHRGDVIASFIILPICLPILIEREKDDDVERNGLQMYLKYTKLDPFAFVPTRFDETSVGYDLHTITDLSVPPFETVKVKTGIFLKMEGGPFCGLIRDKSGFSTKRNLHVKEQSYDCNDRDQIIVHLANLSAEEQHIYAGEQIAQMIFVSVYIPTLEYQKEINRNTTRGNRGFQSGETKGICDHIYS